MKRTQISGAFVVCEGATDSRLLRRFVDHSACQLIVAHEKETVLDAIKILDDGGVPGCVAVIDADFDRQNGISYGSGNIIATAVHDLDVLLFFSPALDKLLDEYGSTEKIRAFEDRSLLSVRDAILAAAAEIGTLRIISERRGLAFDFDALKFNDFIDRDNLNLSRVSLIEAIRNASRRHDLDAAELLNWCNEIHACSYPVCDIANGHDVTRILAIALRKAIGSVNPSVVTAEWLEAQLRIAYEASWFRTDPLHHALAAWEQLNPPYKVLLR